MDDQAASNELETLRKLGEGTMKLFGAMFGFETDYTPESLKKLEVIIGEAYPAGHTPLSGATLVPFGLYLGDVVVRNIDRAKWNYMPTSGELFDVSISVPVMIQGEEAESTLFPLRRIQNFWFDRTDTIYGWYHMVKDIASGEVDITNSAKHNMWNITEGARYRVRVCEDPAEIEKLKNKYPV